MGAITTAQFTFAGILGYANTIPGTVLCFLVLVAFGIVACFRKSRKYFDRVSFRLLVYSLFLNLLFGIAFSVTAAQTGPGSLCNFGAFAVNLTFHLATYLTTCIAINLQLVLVHGFNGKNLEKYYLIGTAIIGILLTVPAYGLDQFGWQADTETCWWKNPDVMVRRRWLIGAQSFWTLLAATVEIICSLVVLIWMFQFQSTTVLYMRKPSQASQATRGYNGSTTMVGGGSESRSSRRTATLRRINKYRNVIIRIALYPIVSLLMNYSIAILDIYTTIVGTTTQLQFRLLALDLILYGLRTFAYAILAMTDPSFIAAIREIRGGQKASTYSSGSAFSQPKFATPVHKMDASQGQMSIGVELEQISHADDTMKKNSDSLLYPHHDASDTFGVGSQTATVKVGASGSAEHFASRDDWDDEEDIKFRRQL